MDPSNSSLSCQWRSEQQVSAAGESLPTRNCVSTASSEASQTASCASCYLEAGASALIVPPWDGLECNAESKPVACTCHSPAAWKSWEERVVSVWFRACADAAATKPSLSKAAATPSGDVDCRAAALLFATWN